MHSSTLGALALSIATAQAFKDTSPFFFFSSSEILASPPQIVSATSLGNSLTAELEKCPSDTYVIVSQLGVNAADYKSARSAPHLRNSLAGSENNVRSSFSVGDVMGELDVDGLMETVKEKCQARMLKVDASTGSFAITDDMKPQVIRLDFPPLPVDAGRASTLKDNDAFVASVLDLLPSSKISVLYTTTPVSGDHQSLVVESQVYEADDSFQAPLHMDLKRESRGLHKRASSDNETYIDGPLFEKYQFLSPGIFMGFLVGILLLSILYVGISGVASLQVSYGAFDKENGPASQKKQQQG